MATMVTEVYEAFKSVGVDEDEAKKAAEVLSGHESRFAALDVKMAELTGPVNTLTWMAGVNITLSVGILVRLLFVG